MSSTIVHFFALILVMFSMTPAIAASNWVSMSPLLGWLIDVSDPPALTYRDAKNKWTGEDEVLLGPDKSPSNSDMYSLGATFSSLASGELADGSDTDPCVSASYLMRTNEGVVSLTGVNNHSSNSPRVSPQVLNGMSSLVFAGAGCRYSVTYHLDQYNEDSWVPVPESSEDLVPPFHIDPERMKTGRSFSDIGVAEPLEFDPVPHTITLGSPTHSVSLLHCPNVSGLLYITAIGVHVVLPWKADPEITPGLLRDSFADETSIILQTKQCRLRLTVRRETRGGSGWTKNPLSRLR